MNGEHSPQVSKDKAKNNFKNGSSSSLFINVVTDNAKQKQEDSELKATKALDLTKQ